jgi:hypothetical protein
VSHALVARRTLSFACTLLLLPLLLVISGCSRGPRLYPVHVIVTLDGEPAKNVQITFVPEVEGMPVASAVVLNDGEADARTGVDGREGAREGKYKVIFGTAVTGTGMGGGGDGDGRGGGGGRRGGAAAAAKEPAAASESSAADSAAAADSAGRRRPDEGGGVPNVPPVPFPIEYTQVENTPIEVVVEKKSNVFRFELPKK